MHNKLSSNLDPTGAVSSGPKGILDIARIGSEIDQLAPIAQCSSSSPRYASLPKTERDNGEPTEEELQALRHVVDPIPRIVWVALLAGAAERFTYYGITAPWQNYMQNSPTDIAVPGALGLGQSTATNIYNAFYLFSFLTPLPFAILSDAWLGRYKTLCISFGTTLCGCIILFVTSFESLVSHAGQLGGLAVAMFLIGLGTGGIKAAMSPFIGDQYAVLSPRIAILKNGERVIRDRTLTLQYIYNVFYWLTNIASLSLIASTYLEKEYGFWAAYLLPLCSFWVAVLLMLVWAKDFIKLPPQGNVLPQAVKVLVYSSRDRFRLDSAKPAYQYEKYGRSVPWNDHFVAEMKRGLVACRVMACFALFYLCINQISNNLISQAGQMELDGIPNDTIQALNPIACVLLGPVIQNMLYPTLIKYHLRFGPIARMTAAFVIMGIAMAYAAGLQHLIYSAGPCYEAPLACPASKNGSIPNHVKVWTQTPLYFLLAFAEIFGFATLSEYSYSKAPKNMRSLVQALRQLSAGVGSAIGMGLSPVAVDPKILYMYVALAIVMVVSAVLFWFVFKGYDEVDEELNALDEAEKA